MNEMYLTQVLVNIEKINVMVSIYLKNTDTNAISKMLIYRNNIYS